MAAGEEDGSILSLRDIAMNRSIFESLRVIVVVEDNQPSLLPLSQDVLNNKKWWLDRYSLQEEIWKRARL
jgi:hypothetical protein